MRERKGNKPPQKGGRRPERRFEPAHRQEEQNISAVYGVLPVLEALRSEPRKIERILIAEEAREHRLSDIIKQAKSNNLQVDFMPREQLAKFVDAGVNHQGIIAIKAAAEYAGADEIIDGLTEVPLLLLLDGVEDPRNLGAILRTAECAGVDGVFIPERRAVGLTATVAKTAAGATEHIKVAKTTNLNRLIEGLKERNIWVIGTDANAEMKYTDWDWKQPSALVLGAEGKGLHRLVAENCDVLVNIPMHGKIESLNVSVAAGVILFEAMRQRDAGNPEK